MPPTSHTTGQRPLLIGLRRCGPNCLAWQSQSHKHTGGCPSTACPPAPERIASPAATKLSPPVSAASNYACAENSACTLGIRIDERSSSLSVLVTTHEQAAQSDHVVLPSTSMVRHSATTAESEYWYTINGESDTIAAQAQDVNPTLSLSATLRRAHRKPTEPGIE